MPCVAMFIALVWEEESGIGSWLTRITLPLVCRTSVRNKMDGSKWKLAIGPSADLALWPTALNGSTPSIMKVLGDGLETGLMCSHW